MGNGDKNGLPFKTFGVREDAAYFDREGAYVIPVKDGKICLVETHNGWFLIGGGMENGESETQCLARECLEETGRRLVIGEKIAGAETFCRHHRLNYFHPIQHYYLGELKEQIQPPTESDHRTAWFALEDTKEMMFAPMQAWAIQVAKELLDK